MYIIPKQVNLAIVPSQIFPVGAVAAIFKNGRYVTIIIIIIIILFIERHIQRAVRGAVQHSKAGVKRNN